MSSSTGPAGEGAPTEAELRALQEQLARVSTQDLLIQTVVSLINLAGMRLGPVAGGGEGRDLEQVRDAIDAVRGLLPVLERGGAPELAPIRDALSQLQMAYAREAAAPADAGEPGARSASDEGKPPAAEPSEPGEQRQGPGPAESSGRLWVPGR